MRLGFLLDRHSDEMKSEAYVRLSGGAVAASEDYMRCPVRAWDVGVALEEEGNDVCGRSGCSVIA